MSEHKPNYDSTVAHLRPFIRPSDNKKIIRNCIAVLSHLDFDTIAFRGLSGALLAPVIAMKMGKELIAVRKGEKCHSYRMLEGNTAVERYVIVDDFVSCGDTVRAILDEVYAVAPEAKCIGVLEANHLRTDVYVGRDLVPSSDTMDYSTVHDWELAKRAKTIAAKEERAIWEYFPYQPLKLMGMGLYIQDEAPQMSIKRAPFPLPAVKGSNPALRAAMEDAWKKKVRDRANFSGRTVTVRQQSFPKITASSLRNISR
jgi:adenine/guanine phosphoribosyltransferase-like PRPP-binding protein